MKSSVITFPGSNCDRDMDVALKKFGFKNKMVWHDDAELPKSDLIVLPGGFSYGDYLRCGSMASKSKIMKSVINFANSGGMVMGICNGFQILVESGLVPGVLLRNKYLEFICKNVFVKINNKTNNYFNNIKNNVLEFHIAHNEGNYFCTKDQLKEIEDNEQVAINYCDENGKIEEQFNPNGSIKNIAGIFNKEKNVLGMMPHPERMIDNYLSGEDGTALAFLAQGGHGCISVTANIAPKICAEMQLAWREKDIQKAQNLNLQLAKLHDSLFIESSPGPVKFAASLIGLCSSETRLPLVEISENTKKTVTDCLKKLSLI